MISRLLASPVGTSPLFNVRACTSYSEFEISVVMALRNKICLMAVVEDEQTLGPSVHVDMETVWFA